MVHNRITLNDIAERCGISAAAVSMALKHSPRISAKTRKRVDKIAKELGYRPDPLLAALARRRENSNEKPSKALIAILLNEPLDQARQHWWSGDYLRGLSKGAKELGYSLHYLEIANETITQRLHDSNAIGMVIFPMRGINLERAQELPFTQIPCVAIGQELSGLPIDRISLDFYDILRDCCTRMQDAGCTRIGFIASYGKTNVLASEIGALQAWCLMSPKLTCVEPLFLTNKNNTNQHVADWIKKKRINGVVSASSNELRFTCLKKIPRCTLIHQKGDKDVAGYDRQPAERGLAAIRHLHHRIQFGKHSTDTPPVDIRIGAQWVPGPSL